MPLNLVTTGNTILASDVNQLVQVLQRQSGQTETGKYHLLGSSYANGARVAQYMTSLSRVSVPVSVTVDEADVAHNNCGAIATSALTANGVLLFANGTGTFTTAEVAGNLTFNF